MGDFKDMIKELRLEKGLTQLELAKKLGVSQGAVYFWENGINAPTGKSLLLLSKFFNVETSELINIEENENLAYISENTEMIQLYNSLSSKQKQLVLEIMHSIKKFN